jgi:hypothetical protein
LRSTAQLAALIRDSGAITWKVLSPSHPRPAHVEVAVDADDPLGRADPADYDVACMRVDAMQLRAHRQRRS